jgi:hypothetical protein
MKKLVLTLIAVLALAVAACGPGGVGSPAPGDEFLAPTDDLLVPPDEMLSPAP